MARKAKNLTEQLSLFEAEIERLETLIYVLEQRMLQMHQIHRQHLIKVKNGEAISDDFIYLGKSYQDLSPGKAWELYQNPDYNYILIDVSASDFVPSNSIPEAIRMPWEDFPELSLSLQTSTTPVLIISEDGTKSVLACELLVKRGFYNCSNISGGYQFWKGNKVAESKSA